MPKKNLDEIKRKLIDSIVTIVSSSDLKSKDDLIRILTSMVEFYFNQISS